MECTLHYYRLQRTIPYNFVRLLVRDSTVIAILSFIIMGFYHRETPKESTENNIKHEQLEGIGNFL